MATAAAPDGSDASPLKPSDKKKSGLFSESDIGDYVDPKRLQNQNQKREQKVRWTAENDKKLLLFAFGKRIPATEFKVIAATFEEGPSPKSIQERLSKLRKQATEVVEAAKLRPPEYATIPDRPEGPSLEVTADFLEGNGLSVEDVEQVVELMHEREAKGSTSAYDRGEATPPAKRHKNNGVPSAAEVELSQFAREDVEAARIQVRAEKARKEEEEEDAAVRQVLAKSIAEEQRLSEKAGKEREEEEADAFGEDEA